MKLGITGSRSNDFFDFSALFSRRIREFNAFLGRKRITLIITGGARGIDRQAEICAEKMNIPCRIIRPDYARYRRGAPLKRNLTIIDQCDALLAVWNGDFRSRGTIYTVTNALKSGKRVFVISSCSMDTIECIGEVNSPEVLLKASAPKR
ncbi:MAG: hypothetical protein IKC94_02360 [Lentisphaeria bacterium]|nr:hypothetical protein [Lentisphaeria bacterium]